MKKINPLSLEVFAARFGLNKEDLSYGIAIVDEKLFPVILAKDKPFFINIDEDCLQPKMLPNKEIMFENCTFIRTEDKYIFKWKNWEISAAKEEIDKFYSAKYYSEPTKKYICGS